MYFRNKRSAKNYITIVNGFLLVLTAIATFGLISFFGLIYFWGQNMVANENTQRTERILEQERQIEARESNSATTVIIDGK